MSCGCGCNNCGNAHKLNGTEITVLSGLDKPRANPEQSDSSTNQGWFVLGAAAVVAIAAVFTMKKGS